MKQIAELIEGHPLFYASSIDSVRDVARTMSDRNIGALAVLDSGKLVCDFSGRGLMTRVGAAGPDPQETSGAAATANAIVVTEQNEKGARAATESHRGGGEQIS